MFRGEAAVFAGLADEVADPVTAFRAFAAAPRGTSTPRGKGFLMTTTPEDHAAPTAAPAADSAPAANPAPEPEPAVTPPQEEAALSPEAIRAEAAEVAQVCAQAARLGVSIDAADALTRGIKPEALRAKVLADLAARSDAAGIIATAPAVTAKESPIVAAARKSAASR